MDPALLIRLLQAAEDQVENGDQDIADQRDLISTLERTGHAPTSAITRLQQMEQTQMQRIADRDAMRAELAALNAGEAENPGLTALSKPIE